VFLYEEITQKSLWILNTLERDMIQRNGEGKFFKDLLKDCGGIYVNVISIRHDAEPQR
jgi:hypothetical protein